MPKISIIVLLTITSINYSFGQEYFSTINIKKKWSDSKKWTFIAKGHWKKHNDTKDWTRVGIDAQATRNLGNWSLLGGIVSNYTYDETISNNWEFKPWAGISLTNKIYGGLKFTQTFKYEILNFTFFSDNKNKTLTRTKYKIKPIYEINERWKLFTSYLWYFSSKQDLPIRFLSSSEWNFGVSRKFKKVQILLDYTRERFNQGNDMNKKNANTISLTIIF